MSYNFTNQQGEGVNNIVTQVDDSDNYEYTVYDIGYDYEFSCPMSYRFYESYCYYDDCEVYSFIDQSYTETYLPEKETGQIYATLSDNKIILNPPNNGNYLEYISWSE